MKQLLILRHAKAEQDSEDGSDRSRPLAARGERQAPLMGRCLAKAGLVPQAVLSSPAARAQRTAELAAKASGFKGQVQIVEKIYGGSAEGLIQVLRETPELTDRVLLVGHNPDLETLVWTLCNPRQGAVSWSGLRMATGCLTLVQLSVDVWSALEAGCGQIEWSLPPKLAAALNPKLER